MKLKRIYAPDTKTGIERITRECGNNVMILSNRRQDDQNVILVALDNSENSGSETATVDFERILAKRDAKLKQQLESDPDAATISVAEKIKPVPAQHKETTTETAHSPAEDFGHKGHKSKEEALAMRSLAKQIREELSFLKSEIAGLRSSRQVPDTIFTVHPLLDYLRETGAPESYLEECSELLSQSNDPNPLTHLLSDYLRRCKLAGQTIKPGIHALFGNHGSGKTTMAIKLASFLGCAKRPAIVVSYRDDKEGAWSLLQVLGAKAGIDTFQARGEESLSALVKEFANTCSIILDTSSNIGGRCLQEITNVVPEAHCHLVLPADTYLTSLPTAIGQEHSFESALVSRLDQDVQPWPLVKILSSIRLSASLGCTGAGVQEKLGEITAESLAQKLIQKPIPGIETTAASINDDSEFAFHLF